MRKQRVNQDKGQKRPPMVINDKRRAAAEAPSSNVPVRVVMYVEVGGASVESIANLVNNIRSHYNGNLDNHYIVPVRNGTIRTDVQFENEFLETIKEICTVNNGQIEFKDGAKEVRVFREKVT